MALLAIVDLSVTVSTVSGGRQRSKGSSSDIARDCRPQCHGIDSIRYSSEK